MQAGFSTATVTATSGEEEASSNQEMKNPRALLLDLRLALAAHSSSSY